MAAMTAEELAYSKMFPSHGGEKGTSYGPWLVGQILPAVIEELKGQDPKVIASRTMAIVKEMLTRMTSEQDEV